MSLLDLLPVVAILLVGSTLVGLPLLGSSGLVAVLILTRTLSDLGSTTTAGPVLPATVVNAVVAVLLVGLLFLPARQPLPVLVRRLAVALLLLILLGCGVGLLRFGLAGGSLQEALRLVSVLSVFVLTATRMPVDEARAGRQLTWLVCVPALVLVVGVVLQAAPTVQSSGRAAGGFSHANAAAAYFAVAALACVEAWLRRRRTALVCAGVLALVALGLTQSLGGLAGFAAAAALLVVAGSRLSPRGLGSVAVLLLVVGVVVSLTGVGDRLSSLLTGSSSSETEDSLAWRLLNWSLLLERWREHPWFGFGLGSTRNEVAPLGAPPHSLLVQVLLETGVVGAVGLVALVVVVVWALLKRTRTHRLASVLGLSLLLLVLVNGAESNLLNYTPSLYLIAVVAGRTTTALAGGDPGPPAGAPEGAPRARPTGLRVARAAAPPLQRAGRQ